MKLRFLSAICIIACVSNIGPVYADSQGTKISMDSIEKIVLENNLDIKKADNNVKAKIKYYDELEDEIDKLESDIKSNEDKVKNLEDEEAKDNLKISIQADKSSLESKEDEYKNRSNEIKKVRIAYDSKLKEAVINAQSKYVEYLNTISVKQLNWDKLNYDKTQNQILKTKYDMGYLSKNEYNNDFINVWTDQSEYNKSILDETTKKEELKNILGINDKKIVVENDINVDMQKIPQINYDNDFKEMIENNIDIRNKKIDLDEFKDKDDMTKSEEYDEDNAKISLDQSNRDAKVAFEKAYNDLISSYNTLNVDMNNLTKAENDSTIMGVKYSFGEIAKREQEKNKLDLDKQKSDLVKEKNDFYINYMKYLQMKEGY